MGQRFAVGGGIEKMTKEMSYTKIKHKNNMTRIKRGKGGGGFVIRKISYTASIYEQLPKLFNYAGI